VPSLEALMSLNNIMFHNKQGRWNTYLLAVYTAFAYETKMDVVDANGAPYPFQTINTSASRSEIRKQLRTMLDGNYETVALPSIEGPHLGIIILDIRSVLVLAPNIELLQKLRWE
jgi:hypothetical protein